MTPDEMRAQAKENAEVGRQEDDQIARSASMVMVAMEMLTAEICERLDRLLEKSACALCGGTGVVHPPSPEWGPPVKCAGCNP